MKPTFKFIDNATVPYGESRIDVCIANSVNELTKCLESEGIKMSYNACVLAFEIFLRTIYPETLGSKDFVGGVQKNSFIRPAEEEDRIKNLNVCTRLDVDINDDRSLSLSFEYINHTFTKTDIAAYSFIYGTIAANIFYHVSATAEQYTEQSVNDPDSFFYLFKQIPMSGEKFFVMMNEFMTFYNDIVRFIIVSQYNMNDKDGDVNDIRSLFGVYIPYSSHDLDTNRRIMIRYYHTSFAVKKDDGHMELGESQSWVSISSNIIPGVFASDCSSFVARGRKNPEEDMKYFNVPGSSRYVEV